MGGADFFQMRDSAAVLDECDLFLISSCDRKWQGVGDGGKEKSNIKGK